MVAGSFPSGLHQVFDHVVGGGEVAPVAGLDRRVARATARWVLPHPGWPKNRIGSVLLDETQRGQVARRACGRRSAGTEVEVGQGPPEGEPGEAQPCGQLPVDRGDACSPITRARNSMWLHSFAFGLFGQGGEALGRAVSRNSRGRPSAAHRGSSSSTCLRVVAGEVGPRRPRLPRCRDAVPWD